MYYGKSSFGSNEYLNVIAYYRPKPYRGYTIVSSRRATSTLHFVRKYFCWHLTAFARRLLLTKLLWFDPIDK